MHPTQWERVSRRLTRHNANYSYLCVCIKWITNNYKEIAAILHWLYLIINLSTYSFSFIEYLLINFYWQFIYKVFIDNFFMHFFYWKFITGGTSFLFYSNHKYFVIYGICKIVFYNFVRLLLLKRLKRRIGMWKHSIQSFNVVSLMTSQ